MKHTVITIGRAYGSGGRLIALAVAEALGIPFYDKKILTEVAKETGFSEAFIHDSEKKPTSGIVMNGYTALATPTLSEQVFIAQSKVIRDLAAKDSCVLVGRCADYILRDHPSCFKVFVHAPMAERIVRATEIYGVKETNMERYVQKQDKARASYYNYFSATHWGEAETYDLCINSTIGIDQVTKVILAAIE